MVLATLNIALLILLIYDVHRGWVVRTISPRYIALEGFIKKRMSLPLRFLRGLIQIAIFIPIWSAILFALGRATPDVEGWWPLVLVFPGLVMSMLVAGTVSWHLSNRLFLRSWVSLGANPLT